MDNLMNNNKPSSREKSYSGKIKPYTYGTQDESMVRIY